MKPSINLENKTPSDTYWQVHAHSFLEPYNQDQMSLKIQGFLMTILLVLEILFSFRIALEGKTGKEIPESSRFEFLDKFWANNFALSDADDNTSRLLRTLLAIRHKPWKPSFWEKMDSFVLLAYASLVASRILLQRLWACLNFPLDSEDLFYWYKRKKVISMNYGSCKSIWKPWRWKRLDPIIMMRDIYINSNLIPLIKFNSSNITTDVLYGRLYEVSKSQLMH